MCLFCDWGEITPVEDVDPAVEAERRRVSQDLWARLMDEIAKTDPPAPPPPAEAR